jgi:hypothetical protein
VSEGLARCPVDPGDVLSRPLIGRGLRMRGVRVCLGTGRRIVGHLRVGRMAGGDVSRRVVFSAGVPRGMRVPATMSASTAVGMPAPTTATVPVATLAEARCPGQQGQTEDCRRSERKTAFHFQPRVRFSDCLSGQKNKPGGRSRGAEFFARIVRISRKRGPGNLAERRRDGLASVVNLALPTVFAPTHSPRSTSFERSGSGNWATIS